MILKLTADKKRKIKDLCVMLTLTSKGSLDIDFNPKADPPFKVENKHNYLTGIKYNTGKKEFTMVPIMPAFGKGMLPARKTIKAVQEAVFNQKACYVLNGILKNKFE